MAAFYTEWLPSFGRVLRKDWHSWNLHNFQPGAMLLKEQHLKMSLEDLVPLFGSV
jgi:hypothetical protein